MPHDRGSNYLDRHRIFGGLLLVALVTGHAAVTDPLALWLLAARIVQSVTHMISTRVSAVNIRFTALAVQMAIGSFWVFERLFR